MSDPFQEVGIKLDLITQKLDNLTQAIKEMTKEFLRLNEYVNSNLSKISKQVSDYFQKLNQTLKDDSEESKKILEFIEQSLDSHSQPPISNIVDINNRLEQIFEILGLIVDADNLQNNILKINEFVKTLKDD